MTLSITRFLALMLAALALSTTGAHVLELGPKMRYGTELYTAVNSTMYRQFATIGSAYCIGAIVASGAVAVFARDEPVARAWSIAATVLGLCWLASCLAIVQPVNVRVAKAMASSPTSVPGLWSELRARWEYGHVVGFAFHLLAFAALGASVVRAARPR